MSFIRVVEGEERVQCRLGAVETPGGLLLCEELPRRGSIPTRSGGARPPTGATRPSATSASRTGLTSSGVARTTSATPCGWAKPLIADRPKAGRPA